METEGWGARLLSFEDEDGQWAGGAHFPADYVWGGDEPAQPWTSTTHSLSQLREFGFDPASDRAQLVVELIGANCRWEHDGQPYWEGEVEPCINGITVANGTYFGVDMTPIVDRLLEKSGSLRRSTRDFRGIPGVCVTPVSRPARVRNVLLVAHRDLTAALNATAHSEKTMRDVTSGP